MTAPPRITVVTPCLDRVDFIADAVESVLAQGDPDVEHIVVDGGSTDGTLEVLARYPQVRVLSEPDDGLYDAINKGIRMATGGVIGHLNSDDLYAPGAFKAVREGFARGPGADMVAGGADVLRRAPDGGWWRVADYPAVRYGPLSLRDVTIGVPIINARFLRRAVYDRLGLYDTAYPIASDRDFLLRAWRDGARTEIVPDCLYHYREHAGSLTIVFHSPFKARTVDDCLRMAELHRRSAAAGSELWRVLTYWHAKEATDGLMNAIRTLRPALAVRFAARGWRFNRLWPMLFARVMVGKVVRHARRLLGRRA